jgi:hypothetical protein
MLDRQGLLQGDLNILQRASLQWMMNQEIIEQAELERMRIEAYALASNESTSPSFVKNLFADRQEEERESVEQWTTPTDPEGLERWLNESLGSA